MPNIHLLALGYSQDFKFYGFDAVAARLVDEISQLSQQHLALFWHSSNSDKTFPVVVLNFVGDNLGLNSLFCFKQGFTAQRFCRMCLCTYSDIQTHYREIPELLRTPAHYNSAVANLAPQVSQETGITVYPLIVLP